MSPKSDYDKVMAKYEHWKKAKEPITDKLRDQAGNDDVDWSTLTRLFTAALAVADDAEGLSDELKSSSFASTGEGFGEIESDFKKFEGMVEKLEEFVEQASDDLDIQVD